MTSTHERFLRDAGEHTMKVVHADGIHRHLRFSNNGSSTYHFDIVTWPGYLAITGDCGAYVFWRLHDMFEFFRNDQGLINAHYWAEKVEAADKSGGIKEWDEDGFKQAVTDGFDARWDDDALPEVRAECWTEIEEQVLAHADNSHDAMTALRDFEFMRPDGKEFTFCDYWEMGAERYTTRFLWCCHAIVWAIQQWDASQPAAEAA